MALHDDITPANIEPPFKPIRRLRVLIPASLKNRYLHYSTSGPTTQTASKVTRMTDIRFDKKPARIICGTVIIPDPNTIASGGVATGSMNAQLDAIVAGITRRSG